MGDDPWRYGAQGVSVAVKVTPRGGRDAIDGIETLANGKAVLKVRVRAIAEGGAANAAVLAVLSDVLRVPKTTIRVLSGVTSRHKQIAIDGDPKHLGAALRAATEPKDGT
ncbi:MAG: hypothetical protein JWR73_3282 [Tardiphaga sp.]|jgi:uncharacterized protein (TIGR00251 family)|nr:hypothetical protein [Tardiphaga sp.]